MNRQNLTKRATSVSGLTVRELIENVTTLILKKAPILVVISRPALLIKMLEQLDDLIEMYDVKQAIVQQIQLLLVTAYTRIKKGVAMEKGKFEKHKLHTVFYGSPGVGKSRTARVVAGIWYALGVIDELKKSAPEPKTKNLPVPFEKSITPKAATVRMLPPDQTWSLEQLASDSATIIENISCLRKYVSKLQNTYNPVNVYRETLASDSLTGTKLHILWHQELYTWDYVTSICDTTVALARNMISICQPTVDYIEDQDEPGDPNYSKFTVPSFACDLNLHSDVLYTSGISQNTGRSRLPPLPTFPPVNKRVSLTSKEVVEQVGAGSSRMENIQQERNPEQFLGSDFREEITLAGVSRDGLTPEHRSDANNPVIQEEVLSFPIKTDLLHSLEQTSEPRLTRSSKDPEFRSDIVQSLVSLHDIESPEGVRNEDLSCDRDLKGNICVCGREDFVASYQGQTATKTVEFLKSNIGKVLIIEEAYLLYNGDKDQFGMEALTVINRFMDEHSDEIIIVLTGYKDLMISTIFMAQPGLRRRCNWCFDVKTYTPAGLGKIFLRQLNDLGWDLDSDVDLDSFFQNHADDFKAFGGDTERLALHCKMAYSCSTFGALMRNMSTTPSPISSPRRVNDTKIGLSPSKLLENVVTTNQILTAEHLHRGFIDYRLNKVHDGDLDKGAPEGMYN